MMGVSRIVLVGPGGGTFRLGPVRTDFADAHAVLASIVAPLSPGKYEIHWATAAADGHASRGMLWFSIAAVPPAAATTHERAPDSLGDRRIGGKNHEAAETQSFSLTLMIGRWLGFLALFSLIGAVAFTYAILGRMNPSADSADPFAHIASVGAATYGLFAAVALVVSTVIKLYSETLEMYDVPLSVILFHTGWGWAWLTQMSACLVAIVAFRAAQRATNAGWQPALLCALILAATPAFSGHAIASDQALFAVPLDIVHVLAGSAWLGTLSLIVFVGIGAAAKTPGTIGLGTRVAGMINSFSSMALICGGTVVATGVITSLLRLRPLSRLWASGYGVTLIVKLALVTLLFAFGAWNWRRIKPSLGMDAAVPPLLRSARRELLTGAMVLAVTAFLVAMELPD
jgi:copper transport protein